MNNKLTVLRKERSGEDPDPVIFDLPDIDPTHSYLFIGNKAYIPHEKKIFFRMYIVVSGKKLIKNTMNSYVK